MFSRVSEEPSSPRLFAAALILYTASFRSYVADMSSCAAAVVPRRKTPGSAAMEKVVPQQC